MKYSSFLGRPWPQLPKLPDEWGSVPERNLHRIRRLSYGRQGSRPPLFQNRTRSLSTLLRVRIPVKTISCSGRWRSCRPEEVFGNVMRGDGLRPTPKGVDEPLSPLGARRISIPTAHKASIMQEVTIQWTRYPDFFDLYAKHKDEPKLIYIIGEHHHCYIGSVGSRGGTEGLAQRYQKPYIERARAIFGADKPQNQPAYVGHFLDPSDPAPDLVERVERTIQDLFIRRVGRSAALFTIRGTTTRITIRNIGQDLPSFLITESGT